MNGLFMIFLFMYKIYFGSVRHSLWADIKANHNILQTITTGGYWSVSDLFIGVSRKSIVNMSELGGSLNIIEKSRLFDFRFSKIRR